MSQHYDEWKKQTQYKLDSIFNKIEKPGNTKEY